MRISSGVSKIILSAGLLTIGAAQGAEPAPLLTATLKPLAAKADGMIPGVEVTIAAEAIHVAAGAPLMHLAIVTSNVQTSALTLENLSVQDAKGAVPVEIKDDADGNERHWIAGRAVDGAITIHYRAPITDAPNPRGSAPPLELRSEEGGFSAQGSSFIITPETKTPYRINFKWDLSALPKTATGLSSFGDGDVMVEAGSVQRLSQAFLMGGTVGREPAKPSAKGFSGAWQGTPPFDAKALMGWTQNLYDYYFDYFRPGLRPYGVMLRYNPINAGGGTAGAGSFFGTFGPNMNVEGFKSTLAHEMIHTFITGIDAWFSEGIAVYYERLMPLRAKAFNPDDFLKDLNGTAGRYYTDILNNAPNGEISKRFWEDTRIRTLPYDRGSLYLADLDDKIRKASGGKRSVDDLVFAVAEWKRRGDNGTPAAWTDLVVKELGPSGKADFEAMLAGKGVVPSSEAFGPCFKRVTKPMRRYESGYDPKVLIEPARIVRGLVPGSAAEKAGLQNGDQITKPVPQDEIQGNQTQTQTLEIKRGDKAMTITYLPRGETVQAYQWERVAGVPDFSLRVAVPHGGHVAVSYLG